jgi:EAL domain-containing protein (putative c-di-GMP-specific phosphodiesterase class I)/DNA-binding NarL/FixJ family response regulator
MHEGVAEARSRNGAQRIRIVLADDSPALRSFVAALIQAEPGLELAGEADGAEEAIELCERVQPDVALVDVRMPGGGPRAARGIRRASPDTRVVVFSGQGDRSTVLDMLEAGAVSYLLKGESTHEVADAIRGAAMGKGSLSVEVTGGVIEALADDLADRRRAERRQLARERRIRRVLDEHRLTTVFQPVYVLGGEVVGVEALARFTGGPSRGPQRWFAEAEEVGLLKELEILAAERALEALAALPGDWFMSINLSPNVLASRSAQRLLARYAGSKIVVEITEHAKVDQYEHVNRAVTRLREAGVRLAIDDAGAGFASLRHILRLGPDIIKLDRSLIAGIDLDTAQQALAVGLISFAERIGATVIAEGIERAEELDMLVSLGVTQGQGFHLARPAPLESFV